MARVFLRSCSEGAQAELVRLQSSFLIFSNITAAGNCLGSLKSLPQKRRGPGSNESQIKGWLESETEGKEKRAVVSLSCSCFKRNSKTNYGFGCFSKGLKQGEALGEEALTPQHPSLA